MRNLEISTERLAKICGVSQGTVDRALNDRAGISRSTKDRIIEAAKKYGYRTLNNNDIPKHIGIVIFDLNNEYLTLLTTGLETELRKAGYHATIMFSHYERKLEIECIKQLYVSGVDGIILCSVNSGTDFINFISSLNIPIVCVGNKIDGIPYVGIDDKKAMFTLTQSVISKGYDKIIYFSPAIEYPDAFSQKLRYDGFIEAVNNTIDYTVFTNIADVNADINRHTAVICSTDYYALKVYFNGNGADIYGFDNIKMLEKFSIPIKSVDYSVDRIAEEAVEHIRLCKNEDVIIPFYLDFI